MRRIAVAVLLSALACQARPRERWPMTEWTHARAAQVGLDSSALAALDKDLADGKYGFVDGMFVTRRGEVVLDRSYPHDYRAAYGSRVKTPGEYNYYDSDWHPFYKGSRLHTLQSVTKTVTSLIYGVAMQRGDLTSIDTTVLSFFDTTKVRNIDDRKRRMTVRNLLTMTAGFDWDESKTEYTDPRNNCAAMEQSQDWVQYVIDRPMASEPGTTWVYNSGATELLAHIFKQRTGQDLASYAEKYLFAPLGVGVYYWKRTPLGLPDTEGGLYLTPEDLAKLGLLMLRGGRWGTSQVVAASWVTQSIKPAIAAGERAKYGLKWWLFPYGTEHDQLAWVGNGYGGQRLIVLPREEIVAVFTGWNIDEHPPLPIPEMIDRLVASAKR
ncbi:MAG: serine hydrolase [Gemmatimonadaceae bacterium]